MSIEKTTTDKNQYNNEVLTNESVLDMSPICQHRPGITLMPEGSIHKYKRSCTDCNKFLGWHNPNTKTNTISNRKRIINIISPYTNDWEQSFFKSIIKSERMSDKQIASWNKIINEYVAAGALKKSDIIDK